MVGASLCPPPGVCKTSVKFREFEELEFDSFQQITLRLGNFTNFKAFFSVVVVVSLTCPRQKLKKKRTTVYGLKTYLIWDFHPNRLPMKLRFLKNSINCITSCYCNTFF